MRKRMELLCRIALLASLTIALAGLALRETLAAPLLGGLLLAFGEAALVGGLADWFAVRALFTRPLGLPLPHVALIPRNRQRIIREVCNLVLREWLPESLLQGRIARYDFIGQGLLPMLTSRRKDLEQTLLQTLRRLLEQNWPIDLGRSLGPLLARLIQRDNSGPTLADLLHHFRQSKALNPLVPEIVAQLQNWADSPRSRQLIRERLENLTNRYREANPLRNFTFQLAEIFGGIDLDELADSLLAELRRWTQEQTLPTSELHRFLDRGLESLEKRLRDDPDFARRMILPLGEPLGAGSLDGILTGLLEGLQKRLLAAMDEENSEVHLWLAGLLDRFMDRLATDMHWREGIETWCRQEALGFLDRHHAKLGGLVEEQLNRLSDANLTQLIESRVGEDLNWIRLNGTFLGGLIGVGLYLAFAAAALLFQDLR